MTARQKALTKAGGKVKDSLKGLGGGALNAFFGVTTLQAGFEELGREGGNVSMAMINLAFGVSMLAPALTSLGPVITAVQGYFVAATAGVTTFTGTIVAASKAVGAAFMGLSPLMKGAIVGSLGLVGGMISDAIFNASIGVKEEGIGESGTIRGRRGVSEGTAGAQAATGGALEGAGLAGGAALLLGANPAVAIGAAVVGGIAKGFADKAAAEDQQRDFTALVRLSDAMNNFSDKFGLFSDSIVDNNASMRAGTEATLKLTAELGRQAVEVTDFETQTSAGGTRVGSFGIRRGTGAGVESFRSAGVGSTPGLGNDIAQGQITGNILGILAAMIPVLGQPMAGAAMADEAGVLNQNRVGVGDQFKGDITLGERMADGITGAINAFLPESMERASSQERRMMAVSEGVSAVGRGSFSEVDIEEVNKQLVQGAGLAGDFLQQKIEGVSTQDLSTLSTDFGEAREQLKALGVDISGFEQQIAASQSAAVLKKVVEASKSSSKQQQEMAGAYVALDAKARETGKTVEQLASEMTPQKFNEFAKSAGLVTGNAKAGAMAVRLLALEEKKRLEKEIPQLIVMNEKLARAEAIANAALNDYVSSFTRFSRIVESEASKLSSLMGLIDGSIEALSGPNFNVGERFNPFENVDAASFDELNNAIDRITQRTGGGGAGFEGLKEVVAIQKNLPDVLRDVTTQALSQPKAQTQAEVSNLLREGLKTSLTGTGTGLDFDKLPPQVLESLESSISGLIGNRQDAAGTTEDELKRLFESEDFEKIMEEFGDATSPVVDALASLDSALTQFEQAQLALIQKQTEFTQKEIDARLRQIDIINKTSDALNKFRPGGGPKNTVAAAEQRVLERQQGIIGNTGGAAATTKVLDQQEAVEKLRKENRRIRQDISNAGGPRIGADVDISTRGQFNKTDVDAGQAELLKNSQALTAHEQALKELISSTDILDATMAELGDIEKSRMDSRQLAQFEAKRFANVLNERDPIKRAQLMKDQFAGDVAFDKLQGGQALTPQDIAALIDGGLERRLAIGVASGDITEEDAENRRAQFNKFLSEVGIPGMNDALGNPFGGAALDQIIAATALGGTAQGSTDREKNLIEQAEKIAAEQAEAVKREGEAQAAAFKIVIDNAQAELLNFSTAVATAATAVNDAQLEMQALLAEAQALRDSAQAPSAGKFEDEASQEFAKAAEKEKKRATDFAAGNNQGGFTEGLGTDQFVAREQEKFAQQELDKLVAAGKIDKERAVTATGETQGQDFVDNVQGLIGALSAIDKLVAEGKVDDNDAARKNALDQVLGVEPVDNDSLRTIKDMYSEMTNPGSIFVHDIHAEKLLVEIVKLLGGNEQHLQRAAEAAKAQIAGLKSTTSAGVAAGNLGADDPQSIIKQEIAKRAIGNRQDAAGTTEDELKAGDGQFLPGFASTGFDAMLGSGQFGGSLKALSGDISESDRVDILNEIKEILGEQSDLTKEESKKADKRFPPRTSAFDTNVAGTGKSTVADTTSVGDSVNAIKEINKEAAQEMQALQSRAVDEASLNNLQALTTSAGTEGETRSAAFMDTTMQDALSKIRQENRDPAGVDPLAGKTSEELQKMSSAMFESRRELIAFQKGLTDASKVTDQEVRDSIMGDLTPDQRVKKVTDEMLAANMVEGGQFGGMQRQGGMQAMVDQMRNDPSIGLQSDEEKLAAEIAFRDQASREGVVSGRVGAESKGQMHLKALEEQNARVTALTQRKSSGPQFFSGHSEALALIKGEEHEQALLKKHGKDGKPMSREELSKKIAEARMKQAQQGNVGGVGLSAKSVQARVDKLRQLENDFGLQLGKDKEGDSDFIARIRKQRDTLANTPEVQAKLEADRLAEEQKKAEAARIAKEEEAKRNAAMTPDPSSRTPFAEGAGGTTAMNEAAVVDIHTKTPYQAVMDNISNKSPVSLDTLRGPGGFSNVDDKTPLKLPPQLTDEDRSNMVKNLIDSGELTTLRASFDSLNADAVPNLVRALSDLNTTLTTGAAAGAGGTGEEGVNIRSLVDAINSLDQVTVNVAIAPINVILKTGGLADQLRNVIAVEALKALKGDVMNNAIDARIQNFIESTPA